MEYTALKKCSTLFLIISKPDVAAEGKESLTGERKKSTGSIKTPQVWKWCLTAKVTQLCTATGNSPRALMRSFHRKGIFLFQPLFKRHKCHCWLSCGPAARHEWPRSLSSGASQPLSTRKELPDPASWQEMVPGSRCWLGQGPFPARNNSETLQTITFLLFLSTAQKNKYKEAWKCWSVYSTE